MTEHDLVIRGGRVIGAGGERRADVAVDGERIASVGLGLRGRRVIDAGGLYVIPGAVDGHVHMRTDRPVHVYDDTFETGTIAAAFGGVTAIVDQAQVEPGTPLLEGLRKRRSEADGAVVIDYGLHVNLREPSLARAAEIPHAMAEGCPTVKLFMSYETYRLPDDILLRAMQHVAGSGGMAVVHAENGVVVAELQRELEESGRMSPTTFPGISPPVMEGEAAHRALAIARLAG
jgi:dihydropyrimidinase